jgi:hypothetical protein
VAHSLGGLVVANALSKYHGTDEASKKLAEHTIGTAFLGTPFEGSSKAKYGKFAVRFLKWFTEAQTKSLEDLQECSEKLASINDSFAKFLKQRDRSRTSSCLEVACFFEERNLYKLDTKIGIIVPKTSATLWSFDAISIPKDHIEMCKFDDEDSPEYKSVAGKLCQWISNIDKPRKVSRATHWPHIGLYIAISPPLGHDHSFTHTNIHPYLSPQPLQALTEGAYG